MKPAQKAVLAIAPASVTAAATATGRIDTLGYKWLTLAVSLATADTTTDQPSVLKIAESDDTTTTVTDVVSLTGGASTSTSVGWVIPAGDTQNSQVVLFQIDLKKRKRYLTLKISPRTTQLLSAMGLLDIPEASPTNASDAGVAALVSG